MAAAPAPSSTSRRSGWSPSSNAREGSAIGFNPFKEAEKKAKSAVNSVVRKVLNPAIEKAEGTARWIERKGKDAARGVEDTARKAAAVAEDKVDDARDEALGAVRKAGREIEDGLTEKLPDLVEDAYEKLTEDATKNAAKKALETACDVIEATAPDTYTLTFGLELALIVQAEVTVSLELPNPVARLSKIRAWAVNPPKGRAQIIECVKDFAPESLTVEAKVSGNGGSATYSGENLYDGVDRFLEKHGVD